MQILFGELIEKGNNCSQVLLSYPYDQVKNRDRRPRAKGRELGPSCLMRFLPKIGLISFDQTHFEDPKAAANLREEFKIGNLGDVIKPKILNDPKYKMKKIVSHEELLEALEIVLQEKVFSKNQTKLLIFLGSSKETFFNVFRAFCGFGHERIYSKLDDADIERERELRIRRRRRAREKRLKALKSEGKISEADFEDELRKVYFRAEQMRAQLEEELRSRDRVFACPRAPIASKSELLVLVFDCFANLREYYNGVNVSGESTCRRIVDYAAKFGLVKTKLVIMGAHANKLGKSERQLLQEANQVGSLGPGI